MNELQGFMKAWPTGIAELDEMPVAGIPVFRNHFTAELKSGIAADREA